MSGWVSTPWGTYWASGSAPGPIVLAARAVRGNVLRVRFNAAPKAVHPSRYDDALNPANWITVRADGGPVPTLSSVAAVSPPSYVSIPAGARSELPASGLEFDLTFVAELVAGQGYDVQATPAVGSA